jgi:hypothetical protein
LTYAAVFEHARRPVGDPDTRFDPYCLDWNGGSRQLQSLHVPTILPV